MEDGKKENRFCFEKVGQYLSWLPDIDKGLKKELGKYEKLYRKSQICESQSYGIGAFAYYRRIVENIIDNLLNSMNELLDAEKKDAYNSKLEEIKKLDRVSDKIKEVKDLIPSTLILKGMNPLGRIYGALSSGLHGKSEVECLKQAKNLKYVFHFSSKRF